MNFLKNFISFVVLLGTLTILSFFMLRSLTFAREPTREEIKERAKIVESKFALIETHKSSDFMWYQGYLCALHYVLYGNNFEIRDYEPKKP